VIFWWSPAYRIRAAADLNPAAAFSCPVAEPK
jgi:hypothetical protein